MKKLLLLLIAASASVAFGAVSASAQEKEKVVTGTINLMTPTNVRFLDEYMSNQLYTGGHVFSGLSVKLGAIYRKHENLSWDLYYTRFKKPTILGGLAGEDYTEFLANPARSQFLKYTPTSVGYGTYYHWQSGKLMLKTGGIFDVYAALNQALPDGVNNATTFDLQTMLKAHAAIKYGWDFNKWGLDIHASVTLPVIGLMIGDHPSEPANALVGNDHSAINPQFRHIFLACYHNYMSLDYDMGVDFVLKPFTITLGLMNTGKWWNVNGMQHIRKINCMTLGVSFDIVSRSKFKTSNRNF